MNEDVRLLYAFCFYTNWELTALNGHNQQSNVHELRRQSCARGSCKSWLW